MIQNSESCIHTSLWRPVGDLGINALLSQPQPINTHHGVDIPSAGVPHLNVMRCGSSKILGMIV